LSKREDFLFPEKFKINNEKGQKINLLIIDKEKTARFVKLCKERKMRLTSPIAALIIISLRQLYTEQGLNFSLNVSFTLPVNMRFRYEPRMSLADMSHHICATRMSLTLPDESVFADVWQLAELISDDMEKRLNYNAGLLFTGSHNFKGQERMNAIFEETLRTSGSLEDMCERLSSHRNCCEFGVSNIGRWVWDDEKVSVDEGEFGIDEVYFSDSVISAPRIGHLLCNMCSYWNDELQFLFSTNKYAFGSEFSDRFVALFEQNLLQLTV
jgi:hypothetical protein